MALRPHAALWSRAHSSAACMLAVMWAAERRIARRWHSGHGPGRVCLGQDLGASCANRRGVTDAGSELRAFASFSEVGESVWAVIRARYATRALSRCPYAA